MCAVYTSGESASGNGFSVSGESASGNGFSGSGESAIVGMVSV